MLLGLGPHLEDRGLLRAVPTLRLRGDSGPKRIMATGGAPRKPGSSLPVLS